MTLVTPTLMLILALAVPRNEHRQPACITRNERGAIVQEATFAAAVARDLAAIRTALPATDRGWSPLVAVAARGLRAAEGVFVAAATDLRVQAKVPSCRAP
jgi:hypothetical protein